MEQPHEPSIQEWEQFLKSRVWKNIECELMVWLESIDQELSDGEGVELYRCQGRRQFGREVLKLPSILLEAAKQKVERVEDEHV